MKDLRYTLLSDGSSDQALIPILTWLLQKLGVRSAIQPAWADLRRLRKPPNRLKSVSELPWNCFPASCFSSIVMPNRNLWRQEERKSGTLFRKL